jgi:hypothetical protein
MLVIRNIVPKPRKWDRKQVAIALHWCLRYEHHRDAHDTIWHAAARLIRCPWITDARDRVDCEILGWELIDALKAETARR